MNRYCADTSLKYGSGTRFKIIEYMAMGKPVVSTSKGAEGIDYILNKNIIIEDNIDYFSERIQELIDSESKRKYIGKNAMDLIKQRYSWNLYQKSMNSIYEVAK